MNEAAVLGHVLDHGRLTRAALRELTGLSKPTISEAARRLTEARLVTVVGHESGRPGPNAEIYAADPDAAYAVALSVRDSGRSDRPAVGAAVTDLTGTLRGRLEFPVDFDRTDPRSAIADTVEEICAAARVPRNRVRHVQLAVAGAYDPRADVIHHIDVPGWTRPGLVGDLRQRLELPIDVDNDVNCAAIAERVRGAAGAADSFVLLWIGEGGLGLAIDLGGTLLRGARGGAGEIGYMPMNMAEAGPGVAGSVDFQDLVGSGAVLELADASGIPARTGAEAIGTAVSRAGAGDTAAAGVVAAVAGRIALGLAAVVAVLDPPLVVLGGELGRAGGAALGAAVADSMRRRAPLETTVAVTAVTDDAALLGAADAGQASIRRAILAGLRQPRT